jgi:hypothetical protein
MDLRRWVGRRYVWAFVFGLGIGDTAEEARAAAVGVSGSGVNAAAIQAKVDEFRTALGPLNSNVPGSFMMGRREINWDSLRASDVAPNSLPADFFNQVSTRGVVFSGATGITFQVSAASGQVEFGNINAGYPGEFSTFSSASLFTPVGTNVMDVSFFVPGTGIPATVKGFGAVFTDVDRIAGTSIECFAPGGDSLGVFFVPPQDSGLSFLGIYFNAGERITKVRITCGNKAVSAANNDVDGAASASDVVVMDDFIYAEPIPYPDAWAIVNDGSSDMIRFNTRTPDLIHTRTPTANLAGLSLVALDFRPSTGQLYGLGLGASTGRLIVREPSSVVSIAGPAFTISGSDIGMDFDPGHDRIQLVSEADMNLSINPDTAAATTNSSISPGSATIVAIGYTNNLPGVAPFTSAVYGIDSNLDMLVLLTGGGLGAPNSVVAIGPLSQNGVNLNTTGAAGLDIQGYTDTAFATLTQGTASALYTVDTDDGNIRKVGTAIGANLPVKGLALVPQQPTNFTAPPAANLVGVDASNHLLTFNSDAPGTVATVNITGLQPNEQAHEIAYRAFDNNFFILGITDGAGVNDSVARIYKIDLNTGVATFFGAGPITNTLVDNANYGFDVDPISSGFRIFNSADQLARVNSDVTSATLGTYDNPYAGESVTALAYDRVDTDPNTKTTLFGLDFTTDSLVQIGSVDQGFKPDQDEVSIIGKTGVVTQTGAIGFDIARGTGTAFASMHVGGLCQLYNINLTTGYAFQRGTIGNGATDLRGLAVIPPPLEGALANISTRLRVETGDNVLIGGFIVTGGAPKKVIIRAIGPSTGIPGALSDPTLELYDGNGVLLTMNDNWMDAANKQQIIDSTIPPSDPLESAIVMTLPANNKGYTAVVRGANNATGVAVVEAYDLDLNADSRLANISTRGFVQTGDNVLIAGTIVLGQSAQKVIIRAIGPSLPLSGRMENPSLELRDSNGGVVAANDNWKSDQMAEINATTIPPSNDLESAIVTTLPANGASFTAIVRGVNDGTGIAVVEVYALK